MPKTKEVSKGIWAIHCPACGSLHYIKTEGTPDEVWNFDGNIENPTFAPSLQVRGCLNNGNFENPKFGECHSVITAGKIYFCGDSTHEFSGQTKELLEV